ncbi:HD domain-containing phosphohydrolase [Knoellia aerolata]|uniref:LuxR family transcriptional regulator n=1 Tax=Knoellia aerolata DSM 18566 TaxID=1385519 RepID=A0A0A0JUX8_9MICO|nr:HD domain-containing phosphohydrolase [Knoellia aerolata]KGN40953.1 hypothetical protein N801_10200 [Knoellia aerolata DSM 18566]
MFRLIGLLGGLSGAMDLGTGAPLDESLERCVVAARVARAAGCSPDEVRDAMYVSLLEHVGCTAWSAEGAGTFGDDISVVRASVLADPARPSDLVRTFVPLVSSASGRSRLAVLATALRTARDPTPMVATCEVAVAAAGRLGLGPAVTHGLGHVLASWDGSGHPAVRGTDLPLATRIAQVAGTAALFTGLAGPAAAVSEVRRRAGTQLDPDLAALVSTDLLSFRGDDAPSTRDPLEQVLDLEPDPVRLVDAATLASVARTFGDLADLKSMWLPGHSAAVAALAVAAARAAGLADPERLGLAGHLHDVGRVAVSSRIWSKPGPLSASERDQARLHAHHSERIVSRVPALADVAEVIGRHHERCDGSGYHRGLRAPDLSIAARVLACADAYRSLVEEAPHRGPVSATDAARRLTADARSGRLDPDGVAAVLRAVGEAAPGRASAVAGLTARQLDVLRLLARGLSNREIGTRLGISPRTAEHHVQAIYERIGASTRPAAALFAMEHGLLERNG